ncbi:hypothetical protein HNR39_001871 [Glaciimonas immobilis]|uniref:Uncharacterized protein n=1 Tax=Glaciimonas immobilis TaxID=728004 RepID=A0A840RU92_9BURK|nr:hypothetical protein [Glaciimonas immobilis]
MVDLETIVNINECFIAKVQYVTGWRDLPLLSSLIHS